MSNTAEGYRDGVALWAAATDRARTAAAARGANSGALLRQFVNDRFLARVFHAPHTQWSSKVAPPSSQWSSSAGSSVLPLTGQRPGAGGPPTLPGGNPAQRFTRPRIRERRVRVVNVLDIGSDAGSLAGTHWAHMPAINDR